MTKQEEIQMIKEIVNNLPGDSYIKSIMEETLPEMEWLISSDFIMPLSVREVQTQKQAMLEDLKEITDKKKQIEKEVYVLENSKARLDRTIEDIRAALRRVHI
jgi:hypothetical protein